MNSFSLVCTAGIRKEAGLCIYAIRRIYKDLPIYIGCDQQTADYIKKLPFKYVFTKNLATNEILQLYRESIKKEHPNHVASHHRMEVIATKMDTLAWAIREAGNTLFIDSDVIIVDRVDKAIFKGADVYLSPHYYGWDRQLQSGLYGVYNAGYLYANKVEVADIWREIFLYKSEFYEQQGLIWLSEYFDVFHFSRGHNFGFWRGSYPQKYLNGEQRITFNPPSYNWKYIYSIHARLINFGYRNNTIITRQNLFNDWVKQNIPNDIVDYAAGESTNTFYINQGLEVGSFSFVATKENKKEAAVLLKSIRRLYKCPVYVLSDKATSSYLRKFSFNDVHFRNELDESKLKEVDTGKVKLHNNFHNPKIIYKKMDCIEWAMESARRTFFLDSDIIITSTLHDDLLNKDIMLSPHFHEMGAGKELDEQYGKFNAGYIWVSNKDVPKRWKDIYLNESSFYEQKGMEKFKNYFTVGEFDETHNVGFSRFRKTWDDSNLVLSSDYTKWSKSKSFHFHTFKESYVKADKGLQKGYNALYSFLINYIPDDLREFINDL